MKVLMIGAGAVGQVYARHLQMGGAEVTFLIKEKYRDDLASGLTLYPLNRRKKTIPVLWNDYDAVTTLAEVAAGDWDQVWLSVSSTALRGDWLGETLSACGDAVVVSLQPGASDRDLLLEHVPADRLINGGITLISYQAPLPGETRFSRPGIAYWFPPMSPSPLTGPQAAVEQAVATLSRGGQPARHAPGFLKTFPFMVAAASPLFATLEAGGWRFPLVAKGDHLRRGMAASREALQITAARTGIPAPLVRLALRPWTGRLLLWLAPRVMPLDIDTYMEYHFTKVGDQTRLHLNELLAAAATAGVDAPNLQDLRAALPDRHTAPTPSAKEAS